MDAPLSYRNIAKGIFVSAALLGLFFLYTTWSALGFGLRAALISVSALSFGVALYLQSRVYAKYAFIFTAALLLVIVAFGRWHVGDHYFNQCDQHTHFIFFDHRHACMPAMPGFSGDQGWYYISSNCREYRKRVALTLDQDIDVNRLPELYEVLSESHGIRLDMHDIERWQEQSPDKVPQWIWGAVDFYVDQAFLTDVMQHEEIVSAEREVVCDPPSN